jgi:hypothetical protein
LAAQGPGEPKVFCFFFSKKKFLLSSDVVMNVVGFMDDTAARPKSRGCQHTLA